MTITASFLLLFPRNVLGTTCCGLQQVLCSDILSLWPFPQSGQMAKRTLDCFQFSLFEEMARSRQLCTSALKNKLSWCYLELLLTLEQNSEPCLKVWGLTKGSLGDHKKKKRDSSFNGKTSSCVFVSFSSEDAHEVRMGYEQMVCFITGEHSALMLFFKHEYCSLQVKPKLTSFLPELYPLPAALLLEIPLWRWQYPDSPEQLHFKDLITPFHTLLFYCSGILARFSSI